MNATFTHTDENDHRLTVRHRTPAAGVPVVDVEAEDLAIGGAITSVWLDLADAASLADALDARRDTEFTDRSGDTMTTSHLAACATVLVTEYGGDEEPPRTVAVVVPAGHLAALAAGIRAAVTAYAVAAPDTRPAGLARLLDYVAANLPDVEEQAAAAAPDPIAYGPTGYRCGCGKDAHSNITPCAPEEQPAAVDNDRAAVEEPEPTPEPAVPAVGDQYIKRSNPARIVTVTDVWHDEEGAPAVAYEWTDDRPGQCGSACPLGVFRRNYRPATAPSVATVTITAAHVETALREYLAHLDYDLAKTIECGEDTGEDTYPAEAADLFVRLAAAVEAEPDIDAAPDVNQ
ncbi:hypothetical protein PV318_03195 [Streptomyces sp. ME02-6991-2B]|nr:hypothetical protein [Streptomyces sp. ME02-6991-2B]